MSFFNRIFGNTASSDELRPDIRFGRYSDSYKSDAQYDAWDRALHLYEEGAYIKAFKQFFQYLKDEKEENVVVQEEKGKLVFELYQGSKKIRGEANPFHFTSEARIARLAQLEEAVMRRLLEQNFSLQYSRFAMDKDQFINIKFDSNAVDSSPYKLYHALKELATHADKQDDLLLEEFQSLGAVDIDHLRKLPKDEMETKYAFLVDAVQAVFGHIDRSELDLSQYPGAMTYLLLNLCYKLDYLTNPEGFTMEALERVHRLYFSNDHGTTVEKNKRICSELQRLIDRPKADFFKEMYRGTSTFGITSPVNHDRVVSFIEGELGNMDWYHEQGHEAIALAVPGYIVGYCLFNYAVPLPDREYFHFYYQIMEPAYFEALGFENIVRKPQSGAFDKKGIRKSVQAIAERHMQLYPRLKPATSQLDFSSKPHFAKSYLQMICELDMTEQH